MLLQQATVSLNYSLTVKSKPAALLLQLISQVTETGLLVHTQTVVLFSGGFSYGRG